MDYKWTEYPGYVHVSSLMTSQEADELIDSLRMQFLNRPLQLPFEKFGDPVKVAEPACFLSVSEQGQELLEKSNKVIFSETRACALSCNTYGWQLPIDGKNARKYPIRENWAGLDKFKEFLASLYSEADGWIVPKQ